MLTILPQNALRRDSNGSSIEWIEGHYLEVVVEVYVTPHLLKQNNVNKGFKVVPEYSKWPNIHVIYKNISFPTDIYIYISYKGPFWRHLCYIKLPPTVKPLK